MSVSSSIPATLGNELRESLWEDGERVFYRTWQRDGESQNVRIAVLPASDPPTAGTIDRLVHEYELRDHLDSAWALRPLELVRESNRVMLILESAGGELLKGLVGSPMEIGQFLRISIGFSAALRGLHEAGLVHKDIKPSNAVVDATTGMVWLTGFGIASRLPRERHSPDPPEFIAGSLAYMAPEQTGRMNRSIDSRSDLYALGVSLYQMVTGSLPFSAVDAMDWVHCHIARKPVPPSERLADVPQAVSAIVMKLLAKAAEDRYQTAAGLERDLRHCLAEWEDRASVENFPLAQQDSPGRLLIPEKLYGRECEVETLLSAFSRVVQNGTPELVLVSGYSGIGKSSVVNELQKAFVAPRGLFASGKFDQQQGEIPYAALAQAFQGLIQPLLGQSESELVKWRADFIEEVGPEGALISRLVPELQLIIGEQPDAADLPPAEAKDRFKSACRRFIGVFAKQRHPLALFLDDLQWLDVATLDVIEDLLTQPVMHHLLLLGAYRSNEVDSAHPLSRWLIAIRERGAAISEINLAPLACKDVELLVTEALRSDTAEAAPLARLIHEKTAGNPFFSIQLLSDLAEENLLFFDHVERRWCWELARIRAKAHSDNVVDLMIEKLNRLPSNVRRALQDLACIGNSAEYGILCIGHETNEAEMHADLWSALQLELVLRADGSYKFAHDRIQEAAYAFIPEELRSGKHLRIGRLLASHIPVDKQGEAVFEIVGQLNRGDPAGLQASEREWVAKLNLMAGRRAKAATAFASALRYLATGAALLSDEHWELRHDLIFDLELQCAECEFLTGAVATGALRLEKLATRTASAMEDSAVACLRVDLYVSRGDIERAIAICLDYLRKQGIEWSSHPSRQEARREYDRIAAQLKGYTIDELVNLPLTNNPSALATLNVLSKLVPTFTDVNLLSLAICHAVALGLEHGHGDGSCVAYVLLGMLAGSHFGDYDAGYRFARIGYELVEQRGLRRFQAPTYLPFADRVMLWTKPIKECRDLLNRALDAANKVGPITYVAFYGEEMTVNLLAAGDPLPDVQRQAESSLEIARKAQFGLVCDLNTLQLGFIQTLRGLTRQFGCFDDEQQFARRISGNQAWTAAECRFWIRILQVRFFAGNYVGAIEASTRAERLLWTSLGRFEEAEYEFYTGLSRAAAYDIAEANGRQEHLDALIAHHDRADEWARNCAENFATHAALLKAEIARIQGHELEAERLYEEAIRSARSSGFVHNEALANELAARFYEGRGFAKITGAYMRDARQCYLHWGADGKVQQLDRLYPYLREEETRLGPSNTIVTTSEHLDLATVIKVSQSVSGEIVLEQLLKTLMRTAIAQAGAERGSLILPHGDEQRLVAQATTEGDTVLVELCNDPVDLAALPASIIHFDVRTREPILLDDAASQSPLGADEYLLRRQTRSVLCLPLVNQSKLIGVLYLENSLAARVFTPTRIAVLKLLASQAAVALENARLYRDVGEREGRIRRLIDANIIGTFIWKVIGKNLEVGDATIVEANDAFLRMIGYDRDDLVAGLLSRNSLSAPEGRDGDARAAADVHATGTALPFEKEYVRKDGTRVPVLTGFAALDERRLEGVAFAVDLTERKRAEAEARESERRYREVQAALAHAGRVTTMGQITASIAHEVSQPISGAITNAHTALRWLSASPPDVEEVAQALRRIIRDGNRARQVIERIRALSKKTPPRKDFVELNGAVQEVIELAGSEATKYRILMQSRLANDLPVVLGDRVQLQQVVLNLIVNAIEAMNSVEGERRELLVTTNRHGLDDVIVLVQDSGPGVAESALDQLFDPFHTTKSGGLGLGLSICRSIIEAHGGRLWAGANVPCGAVFQFTVPVARTSVPTLPAPSASTLNDTIELSTD